MNYICWISISHIYPVLNCKLIHHKIRKTTDVHTVFKKICINKFNFCRFLNSILFLCSINANSSTRNIHNYVLKLISNFYKTLSNEQGHRVCTLNYLVNEFHKFDKSDCCQKRHTLFSFRTFIWKLFSKFSHHQTSIENIPKTKYFQSNFCLYSSLEPLNKTLIITHRMEEKKFVLAS